MIQIAVIAGTYKPEQCGVAHYTAHWKDTLAQRGVQSIVLTTNSAAQMNDNPTVLGVVKDWHLSDLMPLIRTIHQINVDLLHIQHAAGTYGFDRAIFLLPFLLKLTGWHAPIVTTVHEYGWWEWQPQGIPPAWVEWLKTWGQQRGWWDREDGFLLTQSNAIITTNSLAERVICDRLPQLQSIVHPIPIGTNVEVVPVDRMQARQKLRQDCGWSEDTPIIAFFGFLHPVKGLETLLPAFKQVLSTQLQARLLLIGGVETLALPGEQATRYWNQLQAKIAELNLNTAVHMTGYLDNEAVSCYLSGADIGVLPFNHGVTLKSGSLLTMMAHRLPIIATHSDPPDPELNKVSFIKFTMPHDIEGLALSLTQLLTDSPLQQQLGAAGYHFSRQFSWSSIADAHLNVYRSILPRSKSISMPEVAHSIQ